MYYVYTLSFEGIVFYIGCSKHPFKRFKEHATGTSYCTSVVIFKRALRGEIPTINIVHHCEKKHDAFKRERFLIRLYAKLNHKLTNIDYNTPENIIRGEFRRTKEPVRLNYTSVEFYVQTYINNIA